MATGLAWDATKFEGTQTAWDRFFLTLFGPTSIGSGLGKFWQTIDDFAGGPFRNQERFNNFRAFALEHIMARQGRVWKEGVGYVRRAPITDPALLNVLGIFAAHRTHYSGLINRAPIFRNPVLGMMLQFNTYNFRQTGLIGKQLKQSVKAWNELVWPAVKRGDMSEPVMVALWDLVLAPFRTALGLSVIATALAAIGVHWGQSLSRTFGFVPILDTRQLSNGVVAFGIEVPTGPLISDIQRSITNIRRIITKPMPSRDRQMLIARTINTAIGPVAEVELNRLTRLFSSETDDAGWDERLLILLGYKTGDSSNERRIAMEQRRRRLTER
jgi:hypothetical protein